MRRRAVLLTVVALSFAPPPRAPFDSPLRAVERAEARSGLSQTESSRSLVYGGDYQFPPYEYLDEQGRPEGFNIHLIRALAREAGMSMEIRLGPREERMREFDAGQTDVMFLSYTDERAVRYQLVGRRRAHPGGDISAVSQRRWRTIAAHAHHQIAGIEVRTVSDESPTTPEPAEAPATPTAGETPTADYNLLKVELSRTETFTNHPAGMRQLTVGVVGNNLLNADVRNHVSFTKDQVLMPGANVRAFASVRY